MSKHDDQVYSKLHRESGWQAVFMNMNNNNEKFSVLKFFFFSCVISKEGADWKLISRAVSHDCCLVIGTSQLL